MNSEFIEFVKCSLWRFSSSRYCGDSQLLGSYCTCKSSARYPIFIRWRSMAMPTELQTSPSDPTKFADKWLPNRQLPSASAWWTMHVWLKSLYSTWMLIECNFRWCSRLLFIWQPKRASSSSRSKPLLSVLTIWRSRKFESTGKMVRLRNLIQPWCSSRTQMRPSLGVGSTMPYSTLSTNFEVRAISWSVWLSKCCIWEFVEFVA